LKNPISPAVSWLLNRGIDKSQKIQVPPDMPVGPIEKKHDEPLFVSVAKRSSLEPFATDEFETREQADRIALLTANAYNATIQEVWVYAAVWAIAEAFTSIPFKLFREIEKPDGEIEEEAATSKNVTWPLRSPNPFCSFEDMLFATSAYMELNGNAYWEKVRNSQTGDLSELYVVQSDRMRPVWDPKDRVAGYIFIGTNGQEIPVRREKIAHLMQFNPVSQLIGMPTFAAAVRPTITDINSQTYNERFFANDAMPGFVAETDAQLDDESIRIIKANWQDAQGGVINSHLMGVLHSGLKLREISKIPDMAFVELRKMNRTEILAAFGVPSVVVGVLDDASYANAQAQLSQFWKGTMLGKFRRFQSWFNRFIAPGLPESVVGRFDFNEITDLREDATQVAGRHQIYFNIGVMNANEIRKDLALSPRKDPGGDLYFVGGNPQVAPAIAAPMSLAPQIAPGQDMQLSNGKDQMNGKDGHGSRS